MLSSVAVTTWRCFSTRVTWRHVPRNRPRPRPTLTNSVVAPTWKNLSQPERGPQKLKHDKKSGLFRQVSARCPSMEETEAQSPTAAVACESNRLNPPQSAIDNRCFRRPACSTHSNLPGSRACRHRTSTRTGCTCAGAGWCRPGTAPGQCFSGGNGPLCAKCIVLIRISVVDWH